MDEINFEIQNLVWRSIVYSNFFKGLLVLYLAVSLFFPGKVYAQGEYLSIWLWDSNHKTNATIEVGDILELEIWVNFSEKNVTGTDAFLTFDDRYFEVINLMGDEKTFKPFDFSSGIFSGGVIDNSTHGDPGNSIPGFQLNAVVVLGSNWVNGQGKFARFQLKAINKIERTEIKFDYDRVNHRDTKYHEYPLKSGPFHHMHKFTVSIEGMGVEGLPDILLLQGQSDSNTVLNDYLINPPDDLSELVWTYSAETDNVDIDIDPSTSRVTYTSVGEWVGRQNIVFTVTNLLGDEGSDSVSVAVTYPPEIVNMPETIIFEEDTRYESPILDSLVSDQDNPPESIMWSAEAASGSLFVEVDNESRKIYITGEKNWFGDGSVIFFAQDPYGAKDSLITPVRITPVNDPPISELPDVIFMRPAQIDTSIVLNNYVYDVDDSITSFSWSFSGNDEIDVSLDSANNFTARFANEVNFLGSDEMIFVVSDGKLSTSDTVEVFVGNEPPRISNLPDIVIDTDTFIHDYVNLNNYVWDDLPIRNLVWSVIGDTIAEVLIDNDKNATFNLTDETQWGVQDVIFIAADQDGDFDSDTVRVVVLSDDIPTVWGIPDVFIPIGGSDTSITLDDYVWDKTSARSEITWTYSGGQNISVSIDPTTHKVLIESYDPLFAGFVDVIFRATNPESNFREDNIIVTVLPGEGIPFIKNIPSVKITKASTATIDLDDYLVIFPDSLKEYVEWEVSGSMEKVIVQIEPETNVATFKIGNQLDFLGQVTFKFTAVNTVSNKSSSKNVLVIVDEGDAPILGDLPDIELISGTLDSSISLNPYVRDADTPNDSMRWVVTGNKNVTIDESRLSKGKDHKLIIGSKPDFIGKETLIITVFDPLNYSASDTIVVTVISLTELQLFVFPNPIAGEYVDFVVYATDSLIQIPLFEIKIDDMVYGREVKKIPNLFAWKTDFQFPLGEKGTASIKVTSVDRFERNLEIERDITFGVAALKTGLNLSDDNLNLSLKKGSFDDDKTIVMIKEGLTDIAGFNNENKDDSKNDLTFILGYNLGPAKAVLSKPGLLSLKLDDISDEQKEKIGIFKGNYYSDEAEFVSGEFEENGNLTVQIDKLGRYFAAFDDRAPSLNIKDLDIVDDRLIVSTEFIEKGSGIDINALKVAIDGTAFRGYYDNANEMIEIPVDWNKLTPGRHIITIQISDRVGNISKEASSEFEIEESILPESYKLVQNFPNPFNPETTIQYQIPEAGNVKIVIYSILGQKVKTIVNESKSAGYYSVKWDGRNDYGILSSSGIYICIMESGNFKDLIKMIFLK